MVSHRSSQLYASALHLVPRRNAPPNSVELRVQPPRSIRKPSLQTDGSWLFKSLDLCVQSLGIPVRLNKIVLMLLALAFYYAIWIAFIVD